MWSICNFNAVIYEIGSWQYTNKFYFLQRTKVTDTNDYVLWFLYGFDLKKAT